jgi:hypothetical protein
LITEHDEQIRPRSLDRAAGYLDHNPLLVQVEQSSWPCPPPLFHQDFRIEIPMPT